MTKKVRYLLTVLMAALALLAPAALPVAVSAQQIQNGNCAGAELNVGALNGCNLTDSSDNVNNIIRTVINIASLVVGVAAIIMIIIGGLKYVTSGGDSSSISSAKNTILYAIVGLVVAAMAQVLVRYVLRKARG